MSSFPFGLVFVLLFSVCLSEPTQQEEDLGLHFEFDGPISQPGIQIYGIEGRRSDFRSILTRETPINQMVIQLKEGVDPQSFAQENGLALVECMRFSQSLCIFTEPGLLKRDTVLSVRDHSDVEWVEEEVERHYAKFHYTSNPLWIHSWHLENTNPGFENEDVNIIPAWNSGLSGKGVHIGIVDDSVEWAHPDLIQFYSPETSWDFNDKDADPSPRKSTDVHGTSVAGVALGSSNGVCSLGAAFNSTMSGFRLISGGVPDSTIAQCLTYSDEIDIYSNSWGYSVAFAAPLSATLKAAFASGVTDGRGGKGFIYSWAAGNSRQDKSNANYDPMAAAPETIAVAAVSWRGVFSEYSNPGCALHISAPSSGANKGIFTTDRTGSLGYAAGSCTSDFGGTSSACPLVSGIIALMLEVNPNLGWRDVQWVLASSARKNDPNNSDWRKNAAGFWVNHNYGFGVIDATRAVEVAKSWINVPKRESIVQNAALKSTLIPNNSSGFVYKFSIGQDLVVEHVQISIALTHRQLRGLTIDLYSPSGTFSRMMDVNAPTSLTSLSWTFMTTFNWGENARGEWTLKVTDTITSDSVTGTVSATSITVWGHQASAQLVVSTANYCPNQQVTFSWKDPTLNYLVLTSTTSSSRTLSVYGKTSQTELLPAGTWTAAISVDPSRPLDTETFSLPSCSSPFISVTVLDCGNVEITYNLAPSGSTILFQETKDSTVVTVTKSPISGSGKITYTRPYYGNWAAHISQSSRYVASSNVITGALCVVPSLEVDVSQQCSSSQLITITAKNTMPGMLLTAQATNAQSQVFVIADATNTSENLVLQFKRPSPEGSWYAKIAFGTQVFSQENFEVSLCVAAEISVDVTGACDRGVVVNWKNAPAGSNVAIVPTNSIYIYAYTPTNNAKSGSATFKLDNGQFEAYLTTAAFEAIVGSPSFKVDCKVQLPVPTIKVSSLGSTTVTLVWTSFNSYGIYTYNLAISRDNVNWQEGVIYFQTSAKLTKMTPNTLYYAKVRVVDTYLGPGDWSEIISFRTNP